MTLQRWTTTMVSFVVSLALFNYCVTSVRGAWWLVTLGFLFVMAFRVFVDTVDLCCGRWIRGEPRRPVVRQVGTVRRIILEETDVYEEG